MPGPRAEKVFVAPPIRVELEALVCSRKAPVGLVFRAGVILDAAKGLSNAEIARKRGVEEKTVRKWRHRFALKPTVAGLKDGMRSGAPARITVAERTEVIKLACSDPKQPYAPRLKDKKYKPPPFRNVWTQHALRDALLGGGISISRSEIGRILRADGLRPHRMRLWLHSSDPNFRAKVEAICRLYLQPPKGAVVLSFDEKTCIQALERVHRSKMPGPQRSGRYEFGYIRHGVVTLLAALNVHTGKLLAQCRERRTAADLLDFMEEVARQYPTGDVYMVWDNLNIHHGKRWQEFNEAHGNRFHFIYTPLHASWINQVEIWFSILQRRVIRYGDFATRAELQARIEGFISHWNRREAHPFRWKFRGHFVDVDTEQRAA